MNAGEQNNIGRFINRLGLYFPSYLSERQLGQLAQLLDECRVASKRSADRLLPVCAGKRNGDTTWQEIVTGVARANFDLIAFAAKIFDGLYEEDFTSGHGTE